MSILAFAIMLGLVVFLAWLALRRSGWQRRRAGAGSSDIYFYGSDGGTLSGGSDASCGADGADGGSCDGGGGDGGD